MRPFTKLPILIVALALTTVGCSRAEDIGSVSTNFRITGSDKIVIEAFDDPLVQGVTCYVSRARTGGICSRRALVNAAWPPVKRCESVTWLGVGFGVGVKP